MNDTLDELKQEATELGLTFSKNIGEVKLKEKIEAHYESQETSGAELQATIEKVESEQTEVKSAVSGKDSLQARANKAKAEASKTRVVTITDNDQRVNNQTTSCKANCSNMYFDLGTAILPLNLPVEVRQGHLNTLDDLVIPQHVVDQATGLSRVVMRKRYSISYEDKK